MLLNISQVVAKTGLCRSLVYELVKRRQFPAPRRITAKHSRWYEPDVAKWMERLEPTEPLRTLGAARTQPRERKRPPADYRPRIGK